MSDPTQNVASKLADNSIMLPPQASTFDSADWLFDFIWWYVSLFFFVVIIAVMIWFAWKYRRRTPDQQATSQTSHSTLLELSWTVPPAIIVFFIFYVGFTGYRQMTTIPDDAYEVFVTAKKWGWTFTHPNGYVNTENTLEIPANSAVKFTLYSEDVLHAFWIPEFRVKKDIVPGRYNHTWFKVNENVPVGSKFYVYCTEYCGTNHSGMFANVQIMPEDWKAPKIDIDSFTPVKRGEFYYKTKCVSCHSIEKDKIIVGPSFFGLVGKQRAFTDGTSATADDAYLKESIMYPQKKIVKKDDGTGFPPAMVPIPGLTEKQVDDIIAYLKTVK